MTLLTAAEWQGFAIQASPMPMPLAVEGVSLDPVFGELESIVEIWRTVNNDATRSVAQKLAVVISDFLKDTAGEPDLSQSAEWRATAMRMAVPAVLLGLPILEPLVDRFPSTLHTPVEKCLLSMQHQSNDPIYSLYGLAFRYSMPQAMEILGALVFKHRDLPGIEIALGWSHNAVKPYGRCFDVSTMTGHVQATFLPSALVAAVGHMRQMPGHGKGKEDALAGMAISALIREDIPVYRSSVPAFLALGLYEKDVSISYQVACIKGHAAVLKSFEGRAPWDRMAFTQRFGTSQLALAMASAKNLKGGMSAQWYEDALLEFTRQAIADGRAALVFQKFEVRIKEEVIFEPMQSILEMKFNRLLVQFLDNGWDPNVPPAPGAKTMMQVATDLGNQEGLFIMTSHAARLRVHSLLKEITSDND